MAIVSCKHKETKPETPPNSSITCKLCDEKSRKHIKTLDHYLDLKQKVNKMAIANGGPSTEDSLWGIVVPKALFWYMVDHPEEFFKPEFDFEYFIGYPFVIGDPNCGDLLIPLDDFCVPASAYLVDPTTHGPETTVPMTRICNAFDCMVECS